MEDHAETENWHKMIKYFIILGIVAIASAGIYIYHQQQKHKQIELASSTYESMIQAAKQNNNKLAAELAQDLMDKYGNTPYATLAAMMSAKVKLEKSDPKGASELLRSAIKSGANTPMEPIARGRLARILLNEGQLEEALLVLEQKPAPEGYLALFEEIKGDIYIKQNEPEKARVSYKIALESVPPGMTSNGLQYKYDDAAREKVIITSNDKNSNEKTSIKTSTVQKEKP